MPDYVTCGCCGSELDGNGNCRNDCTDFPCDCGHANPVIEAERVRLELAGIREREVGHSDDLA